MALAGEAWSSGQWQSMGKMLGRLLRDMVVQFFPQKYAVDGGGRLRQGRLVDLMQDRAFTGRDASSVSATISLGAVALVLFLALAALKGARTLTVWRRVGSRSVKGPGRADIEAGNEPVHIDAPACADVDAARQSAQPMLGYDL